MTLRPARPEDEAALVAFLTRHEAGSMFPLTNLAMHGIGSDQFAVWVLGHEVIAGALMLTANDILLPQAPGHDWAGSRGVLAGRSVATVVGPDGQALQLAKALGLPEARHEDEEPGFRLDLAELRMPDSDSFALVPLSEALRETALVWREGYLGEMFAMPLDEARAKARADIDRWLDRDSHRVMLRQGEAVAMTGFNAVLPQVVQVGGVYTPPALRRQGLARRAVALHLAEARSHGVQRAVLFAANDAAATAYRAIGFRPEGTMGIVELARPQVIA